MKERLTRFLGVEPHETGPVAMLLVISFFMGLFIATFSVASQTQFLNSTVWTEREDLPIALAISGVLGIFATGFFNLLQGRISFPVLSILSLLVIVAITTFVEYGENFVTNADLLHYFSFVQVLTFTFITQLVFWGAFNRMFNLRQIKRVIGSVDVGTDIASILAFFTIPILLRWIDIRTLYTIGLFSIIGFLVVFAIMSRRYLRNSQIAAVVEESQNQQLSLVGMVKNRYILYFSLFIITSVVALRFIDYSFYNVSIAQFEATTATNQNDLANFLSYFEMMVVIFGFLFTTFITDRIQQDYGLRVSLLINPLLLILFTVAAFGIGSYFGFDKSKSGDTIIFFFIMIAMSKLFVNSLRDALDTPILKQYYLPIDKRVKIDAQAKLEGLVTAVASAVGGGLIVLVNQFHIFDLLSITLFTVPVLVIWYFITNKMYGQYRLTLQNSLVQNRKAVEKDVVREYTMDSVLEKELHGTAEDKVIYGLKLMERLEPALFETSILQLTDSKLKKVRQFALAKIQESGLNEEVGDNQLKDLARKAAGESEDSDLLSITPERLMKISKSGKQADRILAAKLMRKLTNPRTIFILLEMMRDPDPKVRYEALLTARKVKRPETWPVLIDMLASPSYGHQAAAALKAAGEPVLPTLEAAFHKSGQSDLVMLKTVQIMGHIGGKEGLQLLWKKIDYPQKRIVNQILFTLRYINYQAKGREAREILQLLDVEIGKTIWNLVAVEELPNEEYFQYVKEALREEIRDNYEHNTLLMSLIYDPQSVQLVKENVESGTPDGIAYALELMDLFVDQDLKPKIFPLFDDISVAEKLNRLQTFFPRENYNDIQVINYILNRDYNYNNRWTKTCAIHASAYIPGFRISRGLISQLFNQDRLMQETAAWVIYNKDKAQYESLIERLPVRDKKFLNTAIENNQLLNGLDDGFFLAIEIVLFIKQLPAFRGVSGAIIADLADKIIPLDLNANDKVMFQPNEELPLLIAAHGRVELRNGSDIVRKMEKGDVYGDLFQEDDAPAITELVAHERSVVFRINAVDFFFVMATHHELAQRLILNITGTAKLQQNN